jgi:serine/threonine-protein kinase
MPARVTLKIVEGEKEFIDKEFPYEERTSCIIGRDEECVPNIPDDKPHKQISRHHCLLDINPPDVRVRDFGSLNGTFVNGEKIGQREKGQSPEEGAQLDFPEYDLKDGDEIKLSNTVFKVGIFVPTICAECNTEIPEANVVQSKRDNDVFVCDPCWKKLVAAKKPKPQAPPKPVCVKCRKDVSKEIPKNRRGDYVCETCRKSDAGEILKMMLLQAMQGGKGLQGIQGYQIVKLLGQGGMGQVHLARHEKTGEQVALKTMLPKVAVEPKAKELFLREVEVTKALDHPNVVKLRDSGYSNGTFFFTLEFCDGGSVDHLMLQRGGKIPVDEACEIILQVLDGLEYAHHVKVRSKLADGSYKEVNGVVHRDLKPPNIFLTGTGKNRIAKVADFGLGKAFDTAGLSGQTRSGNAMGTPYYMPRQQVVNFKYSKPEVDVWAAAASFYEMVCGPRVFPRDYSGGGCPWKTTVVKNAEPIRKRNPTIPAKLAKVIDQALVDRPQMHFKTAAEFKRALQDAL